MNCIAHRGFAGVAPENTVGAIRSAAEVADYVELDVRRCGSGEVVVVHDETVDRVTGTTGRVDDMDRTELGALDVLGSGEGIPTLTELLDAIPPSAGLNVELKESGLATDVADALGTHDGPIVLSAFDAGVLAETAMVGDYPVALIVDERPRARLERAVDLDCTAVHPHWDLCDREFVARAHDAGLAVNAWTIRDTVGAVSARQSGVDGIITDDPEFCQQ